jgi:hypothetical protein
VGRVGRAGVLFLPGGLSQLTACQLLLLLLPPPFLFVAGQVLANLPPLLKLH